MNISSSESNIFFPELKKPAGKARGLVRSVTDDGVTFKPELTEEEKKRASSSLSFQKALTPEEEKRVQYLKNILSQILTMSAGEPTDAQKARIREVEKELEKITGVKTQSRISNMTAKMPQDRDKDKEEKQAKRQAKGIDPKEAIHSPGIEKSGPMCAGMKMLQQQSLMTMLQGKLDTSLLPGLSNRD